MTKSQQRAKDLKDEEELRKNPINEFTCCGQVFKFNEFKKHVTETHKLDVTKTQGKKSMLMHLDGSYYFSYNYQWELETGLRFTQYTMQARSKDDYMRFND